MANFINEKRLAEALVNNKKLINKNTYQTLIAYIKYLKQDGKTKKEIRESIDLLMLKYYTGFVMTDWDNRLQKLVNTYSKACNSQYHTSKTVRITKEELDLISKKQDIEIEKLLFVMLVLAKSKGTEEGKGLWINEDSQLIFKLSKYKYDNHCGKNRFMQRELKINDLITKGLLEPKMVCDSLDLKLLYGSTDYIGFELELTFDENTYEDMVLEYLLWIGDSKVKRCEVCGKLIIQNSKKPIRYCDLCAKKVKNEQNKKYIKNTIGN